ncbi:hypothetical protein BGZ80_008906 [Entomortierella chlamydospora]|uniref:Rieske domain-containing protein n=1 Tax=Entomortierella chlamydospora TaxID=101097 RepID=A0A9P6N6S7_9FUNG|nr:hypothetical protein BGZ79_010427 [Entomortierella chlamydospora]KAG0024748.1 hypothetical protein BGZ80_008906 [Entomortierella chlamydospora]
MSLSPNATPNSSPPLPGSPAHDNDNLIPFTPSTTTSSTTSTEPPLSLTITSATTLSVTSTTESTITLAEQKSVPEVAIDAVSGSLSNLTINSSDSKSSTDTKEPKVADEEQVEELSPEEAKLRANGLKSTHRPGFYIHINSPRRLRITTKSKTFDLDRYCPHANADLLKWGVLRTDMTLRCGVHYWGFDLVKNGQCIAHPDETLNACPAPELEW